MEFIKKKVNIDVINPFSTSLILLGDFNSEMTDSNLKDFCNLYLLKHLIKKLTCFKNLENTKTIDVILRTRARKFCNSGTLETGLLDFHKLTVTVLKIFFKKQLTKVISYQNYQDFSNDSFRIDLINKICNNGRLSWFRGRLDWFR